MAAAKDLTGKTFGRWYVVRYATEVPPGRGRYYFCRCLCTKGTERIIMGESLSQGRSHSCGCLQAEKRPKWTPEKRREYQRQWRKDHTDELTARRKKNRKKFRARHKKWRDANPDKIKKHVRTPERRYNYMVKRAASKKIPCMTFEEYLTFEGCLCVYCTFPRSETGSGLDRIDNAGGYIVSNVLPACTECNVARGDRFTVEEMKTGLGPAIRAIKMDRLAAQQVAA